MLSVLRCLKRYFYPRSPCGERRDVMGKGLAEKVFLSTLSLRRATNGDTHYSYIRKYFYPRSPCGERLSN